MNSDIIYMRRALALAALGNGHVAPNPMVGAVVVHGNRIIGEGYHRRYGAPHAEVNAIASVSHSDRKLLSQSTIYVTLEPCSHFGKTPPCADLIISTGIPRVVVGCLDPFDKVSGRGVERLRAAGVEVDVGVEQAQCMLLNKAFMTAHTLHRPFITLKWAQTSDGFTALATPDGPAPVKISTPASIAAVHALRAHYQAIMVGSSTAMADKPNLGTRGFAAADPIKVIFDRRGRCSAADLSNLAGNVMVLSSCEPQLKGARWIACGTDTPVDIAMERLYDAGITSLLVEGGAELLRGFFQSGIWDDARVEIAPMHLGERGAAPMFLPCQVPDSMTEIDNNFVLTYANRANPVFSKFLDT